MIRSLVTMAVLVGAGCKSEPQTTDETIESGSSASTGSAGGFSASLSAELAGTGSGSAGSGAGSAAGSSADSTGSGAGSGAGSAGSAGSAAGRSAGSAAGSAAGSGAGVAAGSGAGVAAGSAAASGSTAMAGSGSAPPKVPVTLPPELAAIKLSLLPNWDRDVEAAGTLSLRVKAQSRDQRVTFTFHYGYDAPGAPADREAYKKFLAASKILTVTGDRQQGSAWYLEGTDAAHKPAFRFLVNFGGKRLVCYGSLYKDSGMGDLRDEVIIQAKKICETIQL